MRPSAFQQITKPCRFRKAVLTIIDAGRFLFSFALLALSLCKDLRCASTGNMIKLFKVKERQREIAANANGKPPVKKQSAGELRLHRDISELNLQKTCTISFPNGKDDLMNFEVTVRPDEGYYLGGTFMFTFQVSPVYPHEAPKVKCKTKVYHPNIDLEGNVCLNILREDWKPVLNINTIIYGLFHLFTQPNYEDPLNHDAAAVLRDNPKMFESNVRRAMAGGYVGQTLFPRCM
ncbi:NEDD8-conjugating enzyme Ubc12-like [Prunus yedoensis var. nudiflora]|uniref:NEDD8-conjugating enzyme Ubc12-like n=1 Tax=Prunus yedoensis var. nudiflora TaxID=2094558 RepID=A0A314ZTZ5_PRUYE|nr:NEDD8-conjugating enzyme Ubc12-like [Prunus yedoensis var. nudiflora]